MKINKLTLWESIQFEYYVIKFAITDKQPPQLTRLLEKKFNLKNKKY